MWPIIALYCITSRSNINIYAYILLFYGYFLLIAVQKNDGLFVPDQRLIAPGSESSVWGTVARGS